VNRRRVKRAAAGVGAVAGESRESRATSPKWAEVLEPARTAAAQPQERPVGRGPRQRAAVERLWRMQRCSAACCGGKCAACAAQHTQRCSAPSCAPKELHVVQRAQRLQQVGQDGRHGRSLFTCVTSWPSRPHAAALGVRHRGPGAFESGTFQEMDCHRQNLRAVTATPARSSFLSGRRSGRRRRRPDAPPPNHSPLLASYRHDMFPAPLRSTAEVTWSVTTRAWLLT